MKRRDFVQHLCPSLVLIQVLGTSNSCSNTEDPIEVLSDSEKKEFENVATKYNNDGYFQEGNQVYVNLSNPAFSNLGNNLGYANILDAGVLLIRTEEKTIKAFSNCCPHQGIRGAWVFANGRFKCENHGNSYNINEVNTVSCSSNNISGGLQRYAVVTYRQFVKITKV